MSETATLCLMLISATVVTVAGFAAFMGAGDLGLMAFVELLDGHDQWVAGDWLDGWSHWRE